MSWEALEQVVGAKGLLDAFGDVGSTIPSPEEAVKRMHELQKPGGLVVSVMPCFRDKASFIGRMQTLLVRALCSIGVIPIPIRSVSSADLDGLLNEKTGFETVEAETIYQGTSSYFLVSRKRILEQRNPV